MANTERQLTLTIGDPDGEDERPNNTFSTFQTSSFHFNDRRFSLMEPVICSREYRNNLWVYECPRYGLHTFSDDRQEALRQLGEEFAFLYDGLINEPNENLTPDAIELRGILKTDFVRVEEL